MKVVNTILITSLCLVSNLFAQSAETTATEAGGAASAVVLLGTQPSITGDNQFRMILRLSSANKTEIPYAVLYSKYKLFGWEAVTVKQRVCTVKSSGGITNTPLLSGKDADASSARRYDGSDAALGPNRPVYLDVDFECDDTVFDGDEVTIQVAFLFRLELAWQKATYLFEKRTLTK